MKKICILFLFLCVILAWCSSNEKKSSYEEFLQKEACLTHEADFLRELSDYYIVDDITKVNWITNWIIFDRNYRIFYSSVKNTCIWEIEMWHEWGPIFDDDDEKIPFKRVLMVDILTRDILFEKDFEIKDVVAQAMGNDEG